jgi:serine/threonine protein kinase
MPNYDQKIDVWSLGCVLAELYLRKPLFIKAKDPLSAFTQMLQFLGTPTEEE